tara:strand:- start:169 stop:384 length:216 start_codon:yes stop_codon:yes gene_type:complete
MNNPSLGEENGRKNKRIRGENKETGEELSSRKGNSDSNGILEIERRTIKHDSKSNGDPEKTTRELKAQETL